MTDTTFRAKSFSTSTPSRPPSRLLSDLLKRLFDVFASALGLLLLSPLFLYVGLRIRRTSPGPVFYRGPRYGRGGKTFAILKFRTMREDPAAYAGPRITAEDDPRITPLGRWLRDTKLNELPQLWNVLKGDMSLVGPRPEDPQIGQTWPLELRQEILSVRPGITSPASVLYRDEESLLKSSDLMSTYLDSILPTKLRLDQLYVRNRSFLLDLDVLFWTFLVLVPRLRKVKPPEERLFLGPATRLANRYLNWFLIDTLLTLLAIGVAGLFWRGFGPLHLGLVESAVVALGFSLLFSLTGLLFGANRVRWSKASASDALDLLIPTFLAAGAALLISYFWPAGWMHHARPLLPPGLILFAAGIAYSLFVLARYRERLATGFARRWLNLRGPRSALAARERVLVIGGGDAGLLVSWLLHNGRTAGAFRLAGFVDDDLFKQGVRLQGADVLGRRADIPRLVADHDIGILIFAIHNISAKERRELLEICRSTPARLLVVPDLLGALHDVLKSPSDLPRMKIPVNGAPGNGGPGNGGPGNGVPGSGSHAAPPDDAPVPYWMRDKLACRLCLERENILEYEKLLADLTKLANEENLPAIRERLLELRNKLYGEELVKDKYTGHRTQNTA